MAPAWHPGEAHDLWIILWKDIANVSDQIVSGRAKDAGTAPLLTRGTEKPVEILEHDEAVPVMAAGTRTSEPPKAHNAPHCTARSKRSRQRCRAPAVRGWRICRMDGARGGAPEGEHSASSMQIPEVGLLFTRRRCSNSLSRVQMPLRSSMFKQSSPFVETRTEKWISPVPLFRRADPHQTEGLCEWRVRSGFRN